MRGILAACLCIGLIAGCALPPVRHPSVPPEGAAAARMDAAMPPQFAGHPGQSGILPLSDSRAAFAARVLLTQAAERSLDAQYYIWQRDVSGTLMFKALRDAADRGVSVRLLLDDNNTSGLDATLAALDSHRNIEVRLFNPFVIRGLRWLGYLTDFSRLNRRMHNKSLTADGRVTIIGGRNIGDEYFGADQGLLFADLDVMAVGPVVGDVARDFERYWSSASAYPVEQLLPQAGPEALADLDAEAGRIARDPGAASYLDALRRAPSVRELAADPLKLEWADTRMVSDDPAKALGLAPRESLLLEKLRRAMGEPQASADLISAYFVPAAGGTAAIRELAGRGVNIRVLTNSLEATDVAIVHAGYAKRRKALLEAGVTLYELRRLAGEAALPREGRALGSSASSLHAKTAAVDGARIFVGSFNFDSRSAELNTELGFVIDSPVLAQRMAAAFDGPIPANAYRVHLGEGGDLYWTEQGPAGTLRHDAEPGTGIMRRAWIWLLSLLPIEWLL